MTDYKLKKKKEREKRVKEMMNQRRLERIKQSKYDKMIDNDVKASVPKKKPFVKPTETERMLKEVELYAKLKHNMEIWKALDEEHQKQNLSREEFNQQLEDEGNLTPRQKLEAIVAKAKSLQQTENIEN